MQVGFNRRGDVAETLAIDLQVLHNALDVVEQSIRHLVGRHAVQGVARLGAFTVSDQQTLSFIEDCMTVSGPDFRRTWLWRQAFQTPRSDSTTEEQEFFRTQYLSIRERAAQ